MPTGPEPDKAADQANDTTDGRADSASGAPGNRPSEPGRRRLGVMGGTFDPIHHGHLVAAQEVAAQFGLDEVVFVPTGQPWQKSHRSVSAAEDRYLMTVIATAENPHFSVSRIDIDRKGLTYTIEGTVAPGQHVKVTASANDGYTITGNNTWEHTFGLVPSNCVAPPAATDMCPNVEGIQEAVPDAQACVQPPPTMTNRPAGGRGTRATTKR